MSQQTAIVRSISRQPGTRTEGRSNAAARRMAIVLAILVDAMLLMAMFQAATGIGADGPLGPMPGPVIVQHR